jgi:hypothetical protein
MTSPENTTCPTCGGKITKVYGPGRKTHYRGVEVEYPADLGIRTCDDCWSSWTNLDEIKVISDSFETQRNKILADQKNDENEDQSDSKTRHQSS